MKFFLDENFPKTVTPILERKGYDVFDIRSTKYEGSDILLFSIWHRKRKQFF